ncbi:MAG: hypothetical protein ACYTEZ_00130 [Planctomycetota bacterium]|jgi:hypothetical protein
MRAGLVLAVCLLGIAGLWGWAHWSPKLPDPLPERFRGTFVIHRFEPPEGVQIPNPFPKGQTQRFTFRANGSFTVSVTVSGGYEMVRQEGVVTVDRKQVLTLRQVSENRRESTLEPASYGTRWAKDEEGEFLVLRHVAQGYSLFLRPLSEEKTTDDKEN